MKKSAILQHHIEHIKNLSQGKIKNLKLKAVLDDLLLKLGASDQEMSLTQIEDLMRSMESIAYKTGFLVSKVRLFYHDLRESGHWVSRTPPENKELHTISAPMPSECFRVLKELHMALACMARFMPRDHEVMTNQVKKWCDTLLDSNNNMSREQDFKRNVLIVRPNEKEPTKIVGLESAVKHIENFVDDYLALNPKYQGKRAAFIKFLLYKGGQEMNRLLDFEFNACFRITGVHLDPQDSYDLNSKSAHQKWFIDQNGRLLCEIKRVSTKINVGIQRMWIYDDDWQELETVQPDDQRLKDPKLPPCVFSSMIVECLPDQYTEGVTLKVREFILDPVYAHNLIVEGKPSLRYLPAKTANPDSTESPEPQTSATTQQNL